jgi:prolyl-tRNA synthetase
MAHGDDKGMVMPPRAAPVQLVAIPIINSKMSADDVAALTAQAASLAAASGARSKVDDRQNYTPGWKYAHWEVKGVPIRLELGPRDMEAAVCVLARRDTGAKETVAWADVATRVPALLEEIQADMLAARRRELDECIETATTWDDFMAALGRRHAVMAPWADEVEIEEDVRKRSATADAMGAKTLNIPADQPPLPAGTLCFASGKPAKNWALWGRSY